MYAAMLLVCATLPGPADPQFFFARSDYTNMHFAVQRVADHYLLLFRVRATGLAGKTMYVRSRTEARGTGRPSTFAFQGEENKRVTIGTGDETWSFYVRLPRFDDDGRQSQIVYQIEVGEYDQSKLFEYEVRTTFGFRVQRDAGGNERMEPDSLSVPLKTARIVGNEIKVEFQVRSTGSKPELRYGFVDTLPGREIYGEVTARKIPAEPRYGRVK